MRTVIYARVSTKDQSCEPQLRDLRTYCSARASCYIYVFRFGLGQHGR